jgi:hypothetical protein
LLTLVVDLLHHQIPEGGTPKQARVLRGWSRFRDALVDAIPGGISILPDPSLAMAGELYEGAWYSTEWGATPVAYTIRVRRGTGPSTKADPTIARYWPTLKSRVEPTIEIRADLASLVADHPRVADLARRWTDKPTSWGRRSLGAVAIRVRSECIEDIARLAARLLVGGKMPGLAVRRGAVEEVADGADDR